MNTNEVAIALLRCYKDMIDWLYLSKNPITMDILESNQDKIYYPYLSRNHAIFKKIEIIIYYSML